MNTRKTDNSLTPPECQYNHKQSRPIPQSKILAGHTAKEFENLLQSNCISAKPESENYGINTLFSKKQSGQLTKANPHPPQTPQRGNDKTTSKDSGYVTNQDTWPPAIFSTPKETKLANTTPKPTPTTMVMSEKALPTVVADSSKPNISKAQQRKSPELPLFPKSTIAEEPSTIQNAPISDNSDIKTNAVAQQQQNLAGKHQPKAKIMSLQFEPTEQQIKKTLVRQEPPSLKRAKQTHINDANTLQQDEKTALQNASIHKKGAVNDYRVTAPEQQHFIQALGNSSIQPSKPKAHTLLDQQYLHTSNPDSLQLKTLSKKELAETPFTKAKVYREVNSAKPQLYTSSEVQVNASSRISDTPNTSQFEEKALSAVPSKKTPYENTPSASQKAVQAFDNLMNRGSLSSNSTSDKTSTIQITSDASQSIPVADAADNKTVVSQSTNVEQQKTREGKENRVFDQEKAAPPSFSHHNSVIAKPADDQPINQHEQGYQVSELQKKTNLETVVCPTNKIPVSTNVNTSGTSVALSETMQEALGLANTQKSSKFIQSSREKGSTNCNSSNSLSQSDGTASQDDPNLHNPVIKNKDSKSPLLPMEKSLPNYQTAPSTQKPGHSTSAIGQLAQEAKTETVSKKPNLDNTSEQPISKTMAQTLDSLFAHSKPTEERQAFTNKKHTSYEQPEKTKMAQELVQATRQKQSLNERVGDLSTPQQHRLQQETDKLETAIPSLTKDQKKYEQHAHNTASEAVSGDVLLQRLYTAPTTEIKKTEIPATRLEQISKLVESIRVSTAHLANQADIHITMKEGVWSGTTIQLSLSGNQLKIDVLTTRENADMLTAHKSALLQQLSDSCPTLRANVSISTTSEQMSDGRSRQQYVTDQEEDEL